MCGLLREVSTVRRFGVRSTALLSAVTLPFPPKVAVLLR